MFLQSSSHHRWENLRRGRLVLSRIHSPILLLVVTNSTSMALFTRHSKSLLPAINMHCFLYSLQRQLRLSSQLITQTSFGVHELSCSLTLIDSITVLASFLVSHLKMLLQIITIIQKLFILDIVLDTLLQSALLFFLPLDASLILLIFIDVTQTSSLR